MSSWVERDRSVLWHPFTQHEEWSSYDPLVIERARGKRQVERLWAASGLPDFQKLEIVPDIGDAIPVDDCRNRQCLRTWALPIQTS